MLDINIIEQPFILTPKPLNMSRVFNGYSCDRRNSGDKLQMVLIESHVRLIRIPIEHSERVVQHYQRHAQERSRPRLTQTVGVKLRIERSIADEKRRTLLQHALCNRAAHFDCHVAATITIQAKH